MSKQATEGQQDSKKQSKNSPEKASERLADQTGLAEMPGDPIGVANEASVRAQVARLGDMRFQRAQRVALAAEIGRVQGNQHLQRVVASIQRCDECGDPSHVPGEESEEGALNDYAPLPDDFYDEMNEAGGQAEQLRTTAGDLMLWVQGTARMSLEEAILGVDRAESTLVAAVNAAEAYAEQADDQRASPDLEQAASDALADLLAATALAQDVIEPIQDLIRAGLMRVFAAINRGLGAQAQQLVADIRAAQAEIERLRQRSQAAERELGQAVGQLGLNLALGAVGLALTAMIPPVGIAFSLAAAGGSMIWDRMLGPQGSDVPSGAQGSGAPGSPQGSVSPSDVNASASIGLTVGSVGLERYGMAGTRLARATNALGPLSIATGAALDAREIGQAVENYESLPGQLRQQQVLLEGLLRRYRALGPFMQDYHNAEVRAQALEAAAARLER